MAPKQKVSTNGRSRRPWYSGGLRFECVPDCGACCTRHGDYAYVYLDDDDVRRISRLLHITRRQFLNEYTIVDDDDRVLKMDEADCPFLDQGRCRIYRARPVQCRTFPFWRESLKNPKRWGGLKRFCPGIDRGEIQPLPVIQRHLRDRDGDDA